MNDEGQSYHSGEIPKVLGTLCQEPETKTRYTYYTTTIHSSKHLLIPSVPEREFRETEKGRI